MISFCNHWSYPGRILVVSWSYPGRFFGCAFWASQPEDPSSDAVQRAGSVLRYVAEKRCPELGLQGATDGSNGKVWTIWIHLVW